MRFLNKKAFSIVEFTVLLIIVLGGFLVMKNYLQRGMFGMWGKAGQSFAYGRQYDPQKSVDCSFDQTYNKWYDRHCFESLMYNKQCSPGDDVCETIIAGGSCSDSDCGNLSQ
jgi:hypothetical protein